MRKVIILGAAVAAALALLAGTYTDNDQALGLGPVSVWARYNVYPEHWVRVSNLEEDSAQAFYRIREHDGILWVQSCTDLNAGVWYNTMGFDASEVAELKLQPRTAEPPK